MVDSVYKWLLVEVKTSKLIVENKRLSCVWEVLKTELMRIKYTLNKW
jgi:hypothetical protein